MLSPFLSKIVSESSEVHYYAYREKESKETIEDTGLELSAAKSVCMRKTGLARFGFILAHCGGGKSHIKQFSQDGEGDS